MMRPIFLIIVSGFFLLNLFPLSLYAASPLFQQPFDPGAAVRDKQGQAQKAMVKRSRTVQISFGSLGSRENPMKTVELNLFTDTTFTAVFERSSHYRNGGFSWVGHLRGIPLSQVVLIVSEDRLTGSLSMPGANYSIKKLEGDIHRITEDDHSQYPPELPPVAVPVQQRRTSTQQQAQDLGGGETCADISVLVAYTPEARIAEGGTAAMEARINLAIEETNQSYINSGMIQRLSLAYAMETNPGDAANNFTVDLTALQNLSDGIFENVDASRETHYADLVALIIEDSSACGLAYLYSSDSNAFSVTHRTCATGYYSFGHEIGHNMGAHHDWYVNDTTYSNATYNINKGHVNLAGRWRTVMAYNTMCSDNRTNCNRIQYWSNPGKIYGGDPMGVSVGGPDNCVEETMIPNPSSCVADNHTILNSTCASVANFRQTPATTENIFPWILYYPVLNNK
jgi:hypothetical protein